VRGNKRNSRVQVLLIACRLRVDGLNADKGIA